MKPQTVKHQAAAGSGVSPQLALIAFEQSYPSLLPLLTSSNITYSVRMSPVPGKLQLCFHREQYQGESVVKYEVALSLHANGQVFDPYVGPIDASQIEETVTKQFAAQLRKQEAGPLLVLAFALIVAMVIIYITGHGR